ncbi:MAG: RnfABCDGE type electron transport complex subunit D, partial [Anaerovoracaceae bacterium]
LAFNLPSNFPFTLAFVGCLVAIIVVKQLFGGVGKNLVNPAIAARVVLLVSFPSQMTSWPVPRGSELDTLTGPTPLGILKEGGGELASNGDLFFGFVGGSLGEVSAIALLIGFAFLLYKKVVSPLIPVCYMGTVVLIALAAGVDPIFHLCAGGVVLGACFMATDYVTSPMLPLGKIIFAIGCGAMTMAIRLFGSYPEGVSFAILFMNVLVPHIDNLCMKLVLRGGGKK